MDIKITKDDSVDFGIVFSSPEKEFNFIYDKQSEKDHFKIRIEILDELSNFKGKVSFQNFNFIGKKNIIFEGFFLLFYDCVFDAPINVENTNIYFKNCIIKRLIIQSNIKKLYVKDSEIDFLSIIPKLEDISWLRNLKVLALILLSIFVCILSTHYLPIIIMFFTLSSTIWFVILILGTILAFFNFKKAPKKSYEHVFKNNKIKSLSFIKNVPNSSLSYVSVNKIFFYNNKIFENNYQNLKSIESFLDVQNIIFHKSEYISILNGIKNCEIDLYKEEKKISWIKNSPQKIFIHTNGLFFIKYVWQDIKYAPLKLLINLDLSFIWSFILFIIVFSLGVWSNGYFADKFMTINDNEVYSNWLLTNYSKELDNYNQLENKFECFKYNDNEIHLDQKKIPCSGNVNEEYFINEHEKINVPSFYLKYNKYVYTLTLLIPFVENRES